VLQAYKNLLKAQQQVFKGNDRAQAAAKIKIKAAFENRRTEIDQQTIAKYVQEAAEVTDFLKNNLIQAVQKENGVFEVKLDKTAVDRRDLTLSAPCYPSGKSKHQKVQASVKPKTQDT